MRKIEIDLTKLKQLLEEDKAPRRIHRIAAYFGVDRTTIYDTIKKEGLSNIKPVNITGKRYTHLLVLTCNNKKGRYRYATCLCDCGKTVDMRVDSLLREQNISCGCKNGLDLIGRKFGSLTVVSKIPKIGSWKCQCDCGNFSKFQTNTLISGKYVTCLSCRKRLNALGRPEFWRGFGEISGNYWNRTKKGAALRNLEFSITIEFAWELFLYQDKVCALSGEPIQFTRNTKNPLHTASLDRIDSSLGYTSTNIQWVHKDVNRLKWAMPEDKFIEWCTKISNFRSVT